jgi:predicted flap endonuclease-1-like 5' DNA nuclease
MSSNIGAVLIAVLFLEAYKYSNNGYEIIEVEEGNVGMIRSDKLEWFEEMGIAEPASKIQQEDLEFEEKAEVIDPTTGKPIETEDGEDGEEIIPDDLTVVHKIGEKGEEILNEQNIHTLQELYVFAHDEDGIEFLIAMHGITESDIPRMQDQLTAFMEEG